MSRLAAYSEAGQADADAMVREFLPLVKKIGLRLVARLPSDFELDDLMQVGLIGLLRARESYDPSQGASFATYAGIRIKGAMLDEIRSADWLPRSVQSSFTRVADAIQALERRLHRAPEDAEIAAQLAMGLDEYQRLARELACARMLPLEDAETVCELRSDGSDPSTLVDEGSFREALSEAVSVLPEKEALMMSLYYSEGLNLKEIGAVLGVSESRVSQLHGQALARLRATMSAWSA